MKKLTDAAIKAARCPEGKDRLELSDASCPGLILRVTKTGSKTFLFKYWSPLLSKTVGLTLGSYPDVDLAAARAKVADHRKTISLDEDPRRIQRAQRRQAAREEELSFDEFADLYIAEYVKGPGFPERPNKKSWQNDVGYLKRPRAEWGKLPAAAITDDDAAELLDVISETDSAGVGKPNPERPSHDVQVGEAARSQIRAIQSACRDVAPRRP